MLSSQDKRLTIAEIEDHPWIKGVVPTQEELEFAVTSRLESIAS
jgi:hypothetical protein